MVISEMIRKVRVRSRTEDDFVPDADILDAIDEAIKRFSKDVNGLTSEAFLTLSPRFWTSTEMAIRLTIVGGANALAVTDVAVTSTDRTGVSGATVASDLQVAIRAAGAASATVAFSTTTWKFTIDAIDSTSITVAAPTGITYAGATDMLFGKTGAESATSWTGNVPTDCNVEVALPSDFLAPISVEWDRNPLAPATYDLFHSPQARGTPSHYHIRGRTMRISPTPTSQKLFFITYRYLPTTRGTTMYGYQEFGLSSKAGTTETGLATTTTYYFYLKIDAGALTEYSITTAADTTFAAVIVLLNAAIAGATFSIQGGDLRCVSDTAGATSDVLIDHGESGTDLLDTLTDFSEMEPPEYYGADEIDVPDEAEDAILFYATSVQCENNSDDERADRFLRRYINAKNVYRMLVNNRNTKYRQHKKGTFADYTVNI